MQHGPSGWLLNPIRKRLPATGVPSWRIRGTAWHNFWFPRSFRWRRRGKSDVYFSNPDYKIRLSIEALLEAAKILQG
jgi:hypothetical protein